MMSNSNPISAPILAIVVPCYNEEAVLNESSAVFNDILISLIAKGDVSNKSFILFVDDGSTDGTWETVLKLTNQKEFKGIKLSKNNGHQYALLAGLEQAAEISDITVSMDADLQDDALVIEDMVKKYKEGCEIVYGVRRSRKKDSLFKKASASLLYRIMQLMGINILYNHADYRLASRKIIEILASYQESNLFLRGIFPDMGFNYGIVEYDRGHRTAGKSKYPLRKMVSFALEGITSFSIAPLRFVTFLGFVTFLIALGLTVWFFIQTAKGAVLHGWSSTIISIYFFGAVQLISLGIIGEYTGKIYREVKRRPRYIIEKKII